MTNDQAITNCCGPEACTYGPSDRSVLVPRVDIIESNTAFELVLDLPGVARDDVTIDVEDGVLTIEGRVAGGEGRREVRREYGSGDFRRTFRLGRALRADEITAQSDQGVLTVTVPKAVDATRRRIPVGP